MKNKNLKGSPLLRGRRNRCPFLLPKAEANSITFLLLLTLLLAALYNSVGLLVSCFWAAFRSDLTWLMKERL